MQNKPRLIPLLVKTTATFLLFNFAFILTSNIPFGKISLYNSVFRGRERFPFGDAIEYNVSLLDLDAMFASHTLVGTHKVSSEYRVLLIGDSSVWGTLLKPEQTLAGQLNAKPITACGKTIQAYNLGYPSISVTKDLMILDQAMQYQPDMIVWLTTLEAYPWDKQLTSPLVANNPDRARELIAKYGLSADANDPALIQPSIWDQTFVGQRRAVSDLIRLQIYGAMWSSTGIDQEYPEDYERAQLDFKADDNFHGLESLDGALALDVLDAGMSTNIPTLLVNEPILISNGTNSDIRYNFFYPRWAYNQYRELLADRAAQNHWNYLDMWDLIPMKEFTNSGVHLTPYGESMLTAKVANEIQTICKNK